MANTQKMKRLTTSFQTVYEGPPQRQLSITSLKCINTTGVAAVVYVCLVSQGGTAHQDNALLWGTSVAANSFVEFGTGNMVLSYLQLQAKSDTPAALNLILTGDEGLSEDAYSVFNYWPT